jgi:hypothetical protein
MACENETIKKQQALLRSNFQDKSKGKPENKPELDYVERKKPAKSRGKPGSTTLPRQQRSVLGVGSPSMTETTIPSKRGNMPWMWQIMCRTHSAVGTVELPKTTKPS